MTETKLSAKEIMQKVFLSTEGLLAQGLKETNNYLEWSGSSVHNQVQKLIETFNKEKVEFLAISDFLKDVPAMTLAFKGTEAVLASWQSVTSPNKSYFAKGWWSSTVADRLRSVSSALVSDKKDFLKLWENSEQ